MGNKAVAASLRVRVTPRASRNEVLGYSDGVLKVKIAAQPIKGAANKELANFLAEIIGIRKSQVNFVRGETGRDKALAIEGITQQELESRLSGLDGKLRLL